MKSTNMKKLLQAALALFVIAFSSCEDEQSFMPQENAMKDSIFKAYPTTVASVWIHVTDKTDLKVVLGGKKLYSSKNEEKQQMADDLGKMALRIFGKNSTLNKGMLIITQDEQNSQDAPADGIGNPINIEELKKTMK